MRSPRRHGRRTHRGRRLPARAHPGMVDARGRRAAVRPGRERDSGREDRVADLRGRSRRPRAAHRGAARPRPALLRRRRRGQRDGPSSRHHAAVGAGSPVHAGGRVPASDRPHLGRLMTPPDDMGTTTREPTIDVPPAPSTLALVGRAFNYWLAQYRRTWRGTAISTVIEPLGFLAAIGLGLGSLVDSGKGSANLDGVSYLAFIAPGLLAAAAMQTAAFESTYPVMGSIKWHRTYHAQLATPLRVVDVLGGHLLFVLMRLSISVTVF